VAPTIGREREAGIHEARALRVAYVPRSATNPAEQAVIVATLIQRIACEWKARRLVATPALGRDARIQSTALLVVGAIAKGLAERGRLALARSMLSIPRIHVALLAIQAVVRRRARPLVPVVLPSDASHPQQENACRKQAESLHL